MARPRKNAPKPGTQELALVPVEEQPYPLPEGWKWVRLADVAEVIMGQSPSGSDTTDDETYTPLIGGASDMGLLYPEATKYTKRPTKLSNETDIIVCIRATLGRPIFSDGEYCLGRGVAAIRSEKIFRRFTRFLFINFEQYLYDNATGTTFAQVNSDTLKKMPTPLPPLDEQERIVTRIESLFAKLDEAKEKAEAVLETFEKRKAAILHKAFTGELIGKAQVTLVPLESILDGIRIGPFGSALHEEDYISDGIPVINPKHIVKQKIQPQANVTISSDKVRELSSYRLAENDIILGRRGEMGRCAPVTAQEQGWLCGTGSMILRLKPMFHAKFYSQIIVSQASVQYLESNAVGSTLKNLNEKIVRKIPIPEFLPEEQKKLTRILDSLLEKEQQSKEAAETVLEQIDLMKKAILAKAFRGELG